MNKEETEKCVLEYNTGQFSIKMLAEQHGVSAGKMYYVLRDGGCIFNKKRRKPVSEAEHMRRSIANRGKIITEAQRAKISEKNSCNFNGLNGWGHTKRLRNGYIIAYAPKHPNAHRDGYVLLHRMIAEYQLGRYLKEEEVVHHMNHIRDDNRIENLLVMKQKEHMSMHMKERHERKGGMTY